MFLNVIIVTHLHAKIKLALEHIYEIVNLIQLIIKQQTSKMFTIFFIIYKYYKLLTLYYFQTNKISIFSLSSFNILYYWIFKFSQK